MDAVLVGKGTWGMLCVTEKPFLCGRWQWGEGAILSDDASTEDTQSYYVIQAQSL